MRPHEETWRFEPSGAHSGFVCFPKGSMLVKYDPANYSHDEGEARARLAVQAPVMARLLLAMAGNEHDPYCARCGACVGLMEHEDAGARQTAIRNHRPDCEIIAVLREAGALDT